MKINIGIVGYGNLGRAVERVVLSRNDLNLIAIFSRRIVKSKFNTIIESYDNISLYKEKIDIMILCGGSFSDIEKQTRDALLYFDCINSFDNHKKILSEYKNLNLIATKSNHRLVMACGWDPGVFSILRTLFYAFSNEQPNVFWGTGISMGHSDAIRKLTNVIDAVEFTIPNESAKRLARNGKLLKDEALHRRECFVYAKKKYHKSLEKQIKNIPDYFKGQETKVEFVEAEQLLKLRSKLSHKGEIISNFKTLDGFKCSFNFKLKTQSNPALTATIMTKYIEAISNLRRNNLSGVFTPINIPISFLFKPETLDNIIEKFC